MKLDRRLTPILVTAALACAAPRPAAAQQVLVQTEALDFARPESWAMKYYASLALPTALDVPRERARGEIHLGIEGGSVPQLSEEQRRIGFNGTKVEDVNRTSYLGRLRGSVGLGRSFTAELAYTPPVEAGGARPHMVALGLGRAFALSSALRLGVRAYGLVGAVDVDVTCSAGEVAAGDDRRRNPFQCVAPSRDESRQKVVGLELAAGHDGRSRLKPYAGIAVNYMDLEFRVNALYSAGRIEDHTIQLTSGTTVSATAGLTYEASARLRVTAELFHSSLKVTRPPSATSAGEGLLNGRVLVSYRVR
jgi:hypothetical protein